MKKSLHRPKQFKSLMDNYRSLITAMAFLIISCSAHAQYDSNKVKQVVPSYGFDWKNGKFINTLFFPTDTSFKIKVADSNAVALKNGQLYQWNGYYWLSMVGGSGIQDIYRRVDSVFFSIGGIETFAFIDSVGSGGGGATNTSIGSAFKIAINGTNNIKSLAANWGVILDSTTSGQVGVKADSNAIKLLSGWGGTGIDTTGAFVTDIIRVPGVDSFYYRKGGVLYGVKDSIGGGGGSTNTSIGSAYKIAVNGTNNIKSLGANWGVKLDSATTGQVGVRVDSTDVASHWYVDSSNSRFINYINTPSFSALTGYTAVGSPTYSFGGGKVIFTGVGAAGAYTKYIKNDLNVLNESNTLSTTITLDAAPDANSYGVAIGFKTSNIYCATVSVIAGIVTATGANFGKLYIYGEYGAQLTYGNTNTDLNNGDVIKLSLTHNQWQWRLVVENYTQGWVEMQNLETSDGGFVPLLGHNTSNPAFFHKGGNISVDSFKYTINAPVFSDIMFVGNSITYGQDATFQNNRWVNLVGNPVNNIFSGGGCDVSQNVVDRLDEIVAIHPDRVILHDIAGNDIAQAISSVTWNANLITINTTLKNAGIESIWTNGQPRTGLDETAQKTFIEATFKGNLIIDTWTPMLGTGTDANVTYMSDATHPNNKGMIITANAVNGALGFPKVGETLNNQIKFGSSINTDTSSANLTYSVPTNRVVLDSGSIQFTSEVSFSNSAVGSISAQGTGLTLRAKSGSGLAHDFMLYDLAGNGILSNPHSTANLVTQFNLGVGMMGVATPDSNLTVNLGTWLKRGVRFSGLPSGVAAKRVMADATGKLYLSDSTSYTASLPIVVTGMVISADTTTANSGLTTLYQNSLKLSTATAASTYQPLATNLTSIGGLANTAGYLKNNGSGTFTYDNPAGAGTVTDMSIVSANGFAGTVATSTTTPAVTLSTTVTGLLKGNGTAISAAAANTDYLPVASPTSTGTLTANAISLGTRVIATAAGTTTVVAADPYYTVFTGVTTQTVVLPDATTLSVGHKYGFDNGSTGLVTVNTNGGANLWTIADGTDFYITLTDNSTAAGAWEKDYKAAKLSTGKKLTVSNSMTLQGTDATTFTMPQISGILGADWGTKRVQWHYGNGGGTGVNTLGWTITAQGTATTLTPATTNRYTQSPGIEYLVTVAATTAVAGFRATAADHFFGNSAGNGGFDFVCRFAPATGVATTTNRCFVGVSSSSGAITDIEPSIILNMCGIGWDAADVNIQFMSNDGTGAATKISTGIAVPLVDRTSLYELRMFVAPNSSTIYYTFADLAEGGTVVTGSTSTDTPTVNTMLLARGWMSVGGTSSVIGFGLKSVKMESNY